MTFDVLVIGGGHAGAEAASAAARMGARVALVTMDPAKVGAMSCNPAVGGQAKGQLVREIDALGGVMGRAIDASGIQFRVLNRSKGPAVWGPRAQADKHRYAAAVQALLGNVMVVKGEVADFDVRDGRLRRVILADGTSLACAACVLTTGTFLRGLMHTGETKTVGGRIGEAAAGPVSAALQRLGFELGRLKTGTPPRLRRDTIDFERFERQPGDARPMPFSFAHEYATPADDWTPRLPQIDCWIGSTTPAAHDLIRANLHRAPMFSGQIEGVGPRYCPSVEDKIVRFADKPQHQLFLEPEGLDTDEIYVNGLSTSLPADVQRAVLASIPGLDRAEVTKWGYAVEYDVAWPWQVDATLQSKPIAGLFLAGQLNGTSGYEEAAAQGVIAGVNAARFAATGVADFVLGRAEAYMGVLVDDLVTKHPTEPYRMFTSRAEHRLSLRADNADERVTPIGRKLGLVGDAQWAAFEARRAALDVLLASGAADALRRTEVTAATLALPGVPAQLLRLAEVRLKYAGYVERERRAADRFRALEHKPIPRAFDYARVVGLRSETRAKLQQFTPMSLGQALRISGVTPADVTLLAVHLHRNGSGGRGP